MTTGKTELPNSTFTPWSEKVPGVFTSADAVFVIVDKAFKAIAWNVSAAIAVKAADNTPGWSVRIGAILIFVLASVGAMSFIAPHSWRFRDKLGLRISSRLVRILILGAYWVVFAVFWMIVNIGVKEALTASRI